jgi:hypothetical protein
MGEGSLAIWAVAGAALVVVLVNVAVLNRGGSRVARELDTETLQLIHTRLLECETAATAMPATCNDGSAAVPYALPTCPPPPLCPSLDLRLNASAEVLAQATVIAQMRKLDFHAVHAQYAQSQKSSDELRLFYNMALAELGALRKQLRERDAELEAKSPRPSQPLLVPGEPTAAQLVAWAASVPTDAPLRTNGKFFTSANWKILRSLQVVIATGSINHKTRAALHLQTWTRLMPNASEQVMFVSNKDDKALEPIPVLALTPDDLTLNGFHSAQWRFIRALATLANRTWPGGAPKWVYMLDDDAFLHVPHMAAMLATLEGEVGAPKYFAEICSMLGGVPFPCGGGGMLVSLPTLRGAWRQLQTCHLARDGQMGQYDVAVSHCFEAAGISLQGRAEFCSQPPGYYDPNGKVGTGHEAFLRQISFHYVTRRITAFHEKILAEKPLWPDKH